MEYSEIPKDISTLKNEKGNLIYNSSHVCMNMFSVKFLEIIATQKNKLLP
jgi:hypothetical protein